MHSLGEERKLLVSSSIALPTPNRQNRIEHRRMQGSFAAQNAQRIAIEHTSWQPGQHQKRPRFDGAAAPGSGHADRNAALSWIIDMAGNRLPRSAFDRLKALKPAHCWNCWKQGHIADSCPASKRNYGIKPEPYANNGKGKRKF